jgi:hypothetical protein
VRLKTSARSSSAEAETRTVSTVGAFRVVAASELSDHLDRPADPRDGDLRRLRERGLVQTCDWTAAAISPWH